MTLRTRLVITAGLVCHLLPAGALFTSRLLAQETRPAKTFAVARFQADAPQQFAPGSAPPVEEPVTVHAREQEMAGNVFHLRGDVEIDFRDFRFTADGVTYDRSTGDIGAQGHVQVEGGPYDERVQASRATYNLRTQTGEFHDVVGSTGMRLRGRRVYLTSPNPFVFTGKVVEKVSPTRYVVHDGSVTSCEMPRPAWTFNAVRMVVDTGRDARLYHSTFRLRGVPVLYLPFAAHPTGRARETGFLIPSLGISSRKGTTVGESFYWAINRSMDATIGAEYYSDRGWAQHGEFRARPSDTSFVEARYFGVLDRGFGPQKIDQGGEEVQIASEALLPWDVRAVVNLDYLSSFAFRLAFTENFSQAVNSEVESEGFLSRNWRGFSLNTLFSRYQNFQSSNRGDVVRILHAPSFESSTVERRLGRTPVVWSYEAALEGVSRTEPGFSTVDLVGRFDLNPRVSVPLVIGGWSVRPELALRNTYYTQRVLPNGGIGIPVTESVNRRAYELALELRPPSLARIFEGQIRGRKLKHAIEPRLRYRYVNGVANFGNIIRFDARDIFSDTNELEYALVNRLYARRSADSRECSEAAAEPPPEAGDWRRRRADPQVQGPAESNCERAGSVREIITWEVAQKAFFNEDFGGALVRGRRNVLTASADFSGIAFLTEPRTLSPVISRLRVHTSSTTDVQWNLDYDGKPGRISGSTAIFNWRRGDYFLGGSHAFLIAPGEIFTTQPLVAPDRFNQFRVLAGYGHPNKRGISFAGNVGIDQHFDFLQYSTGQLSYNWDCIGFSFEYRRFALGSVRNENQFRFALNLANIGTFGTLRRAERLF